MIPPAILAEAREAFESKYFQNDRFEAALAVLSRHWPADAAGLREADQIGAVLDRMLTRLAVSDSYAAGGGSPHVWRIQNSHIRGMVADIRAALSTPAPDQSSAPVPSPEAVARLVEADAAGMSERTASDDQRILRLEVCRARDKAFSAIEAAPHLTEQQKNELTNLWTVALRMSLHISDGHLSLERMRSW